MRQDWLRVGRVPGVLSCHGQRAGKCFRGGAHPAHLAEAEPAGVGVIERCERMLGGGGVDEISRRCLDDELHAAPQCSRAAQLVVLCGCAHARHSATDQWWMSR